MKLAIQHTLLPGDTLTEKFQHAAGYGFDGIELAAWGFDGPMWEHADVIQRAIQASGMTISSLCTQRTDDLIHPDAAERANRAAGLVQYLRLADGLGAAGVVALPVRKDVRLPDLSPVADEHNLITQLTLAALHDALELTQEMRTSIFLEPLNRYETHYLNTVGHAADLCRQSGDARVQIMADLFHMSIEESGLASSIEAVIDHVGHVHLADSNRLEPGRGHTDFGPVFATLKRAGYFGWLAFECGLSGAADDVLPDCVRRLRADWAQA